MTFESPELFILLIVIPFLLYLKNRTNWFAEGKLAISNLSLFKQAQKSSSIPWIELPFFLMILSLVMLITAVAEPQLKYKKAFHNAEGIEIILAVDISISMWFLDDDKEIMKGVGINSLNGRVRRVYKDTSNTLQPRISIAKKVIEEFIDKRLSDKIGLVVFKTRALTLTPPTIKLNYLKRLIRHLNLSLIKRYDGTAIGDAIGTSINALRYSKSKNKIIILITDGNDNQESLTSTILSQKKAAQIASNNKIKIYTIGMGGTGRVFAPHVLGRTILSYEEYEKSIYFIEYGREQINEYPLRQISAMTGGKFYRASNEAKLKSIYADIDKLEKSKFKEQFILEKKPIYFYFLYPGLILLILALGLKHSFLRVLP